VRILYRLGQFWRTISFKIDLIELEQAMSLLTEAQWALFRQLQSSEQSHALAMVRTLLERGEDQPDLLVAALLHDVGKLCYRMNPIERALVVLVEAVIPGQAQCWGKLPPDGWDGLPGWKKAFIVAEQHPKWGAEMSREAGVSPLTESLIRKHHDSACQEATITENSLLHKLWLVDNER
jgi:hypothetical protein